MTEFTFYDNEATGTSVRHDQITQFGGVSCDEALNVVDSLSTFVRLLPYVVPHPDALRVTGKKPWDLTDPSLPTEYEAAEQISAFLSGRKRVRAAARVFVTFNGIKYDDEMLRTMMFRNMREPYFNSAKTDMRVDLYHLMRLVHSAGSGSFVWPEQPDGKVSMRLEHLCAANGIEMRAHDAAEDAFATKDLFGLLREREPWAVDLAFSCANKARIDGKMEQARRDGKVLVSFTHFGKPDFAPIVPLASDSGRCLTFDLRSAAQPDAKAAADPEILYNGESPYRLLYTKKFPLLLDELEYEKLTGETLPDYVRQRSSQINGDESIAHSFKDSMSSDRREKVNKPSNEELIYGRFLEGNDRAQMTRFNAARSWIERAQVHFDDARLRDFSARIVLEAYRNGTAALPSAVVEGLSEDCAEAFSRPYAQANERYSTLDGCAAMGDEAWKDWARERFGDHPSLCEEADAPENAAETTPPRRQLAFEF